MNISKLVAGLAARSFVRNQVEAVLQRSVPAIVLQQSRDKTRWVKRKARFAPAVPNFDYSGDKTLELIKVDDESIFTYTGVDTGEYPDVEKEMLKVQNANRREQMDLVIKKTIEKYGRDETDTDSPEVRVAILTMKIRNGIRHMQQFPKDKVSKSSLVEQIQLRRRLLKELRNYDINRFDWLCEELGLTWDPYPRYHKYIPRKSRLRATAVKEMIEMKESKLAELQAQLADERREYYMKKKEVMEGIRAEQEKLAEEAESLENARIKTGNRGDTGEIALKLAYIKPVNREKWWRKHPEVLKIRWGPSARIAQRT